MVYFYYIGHRTGCVYYAPDRIKIKQQRPFTFSTLRWRIFIIAVDQSPENGNMQKKFELKHDADKDCEMLQLLFSCGQPQSSWEVLSRAQNRKSGITLVALKIAALFCQKCGFGQLHLAEFPSCPEGKCSPFKSQPVTQSILQALTDYAISPDRSQSF